MKQKPTLGFYEIARNGQKYEDALKSAEKAGYKYMFRWVNSDLSWTFFQTTSNKASKEAAKLYLTERGKKIDKNMTLKEADRFYSEFVDVIEIKEELKNI